MPKSITAPLSERALLARLNRHLEKDGIQIRKCRPGSRPHEELGDYYSVDCNRGTITAKHVDLTAWGKEMKVLESYEELVK